MSTRLFFSFLISVFIIYSAGAQTVNILADKPGVSFRGLSAVTDKLIWVSGSGGTIGKTLDGGLHWLWLRVPGHEDRDFRDVEAFDSNNAVIMAAGEPATILRTSDGGDTWKMVYSNPARGMFLDAMDFRDARSGIVIGDPVAGRFFIAKTADGGVTWKEMEGPVAEVGEACFAASGTNICFLGRNDFCFVTGGKFSRLYWKDKWKILDLLQGKETQGANAVAVHRDGNSLAIVGGDFTVDTLKTGNCVISLDAGQSWIRPSNPPNGYRSSVVYLSDTRLVSCGITGVDISLDRGLNWNAISSPGFHVCSKSKKGSLVFFAGSGKIGVLEF